MARIPELSPEEKAKPYSKFYYIDPTPLDPELAEQVKNPHFVDPAKALQIENFNDLLNPGSFEVENGIAMLPNGAATVAVNVMFPGCTGDMIYWWFAWSSLESLRYKIWAPDSHFSMDISDEDRKKVLDPRTPLAYKVQGITHYPVEDVGDGPVKVPMAFMKPEDLGFDMSRFKPPAAVALISGNVKVPTFGDMPEMDVLPVVDMGFWRDVPGGIEMRGRFFMGYHIFDRKPKLMLPEGVKIPPSMPIGVFRHLATEMSHLAGFLPQLYKEMEGRIA